MIGRMRAGLYSSIYTSDTSYLAHSEDYRAGLGTKRVILGCHGRGGYSYQYAPASSSQPGRHTPHLVDTAGYALLGIDHSAINAWGDPTAMRAMDDAYNYLKNTFLMSSSKIALQGWSMGGLTALNWAIRNPTKVSAVWLWNPATDIRYYRDSGAPNYTPTYSVAGASAAQGAYTAEINTVYGSSTTASSAYTIPPSGSPGIIMTVASAKEFADGNVLGGTALPQATVAGVAFTYTGKTDTSLIGCVSTTGSTITVASAAAITSVWATQYPAYSPWERAAAYSAANGITFPIKIVQATDDTTVPPAMNSDGTAGFVARANNPNITLRTPAVGGGHSAVIDAITSTEIASFFDSGQW